MYTVYGIYEAGSNVALYIGSTSLTLGRRWSTHLTSAPKPAKRQHPQIIEKVELFRKHRDGAIKLEIRPIAKFSFRRSALKAEREAIQANKPRLNIHSRYAFSKGDVPEFCSKGHKLTPRRSRVVKNGRRATMYCGLCASERSRAKVLSQLRNAA